MNRPPVDPAVERYLDRVRASLRGVPRSEVEDILLELRGHLAERAESAGDLESALRSLGDPEDLARQYRTASAATRAECSGSPIVILHTLFLLRQRSRAGWYVLVVAAFGYAWGAALGGAAVEKALSPHDVGLWIRPGSLSLPRVIVDGPGPPGTRELLGWWFIPFGLLACALLVFLTRRFALWWIRRAREGREAQVP